MAESLLNAQRARIAEAIAKKPGWAPDEYTLQLLADWDHGVVPIAVAIPQKKMIAWSPAFALLAKAGPVSNMSPGGFEAILRERPELWQQAPPRALASLATRFFDFGEAIGQASFALPVSATRGVRLPRADAEPLRNGETLVFYAYSGERMRLYDCSLTRTASGACTGKCVRLQADAAVPP